MKKFDFYKIILSLFFLIFSGFNGQSQILEWIKSAKTLDGFNYTYYTTVDVNGNVYVTGCLQGSFDADFGDGIFMVESVELHRQTYVLKLDPNGNFLWIKTFKSAPETTTDSMPTEIKTFGDDIVYVSGIFWGEIDFDPGDDTLNLSSPDPTKYDGYLARLDGDGNLIWAQRYGGTSWDEIAGMTIDGEGNLFAVGYFADTVDFDGGPGEHIEISEGLQEGFLLKVNPSGDFQWVKTFTAEDFCRMKAVSVSPLNDIYVSGEFRGTVDADPGVGTDFRTSTPLNHSMLMVKLDEDGNYLWSRQNNSNSNVYPEKILADSNCVYFTSYCRDSMDVDPGPAELNLFTGTVTRMNSFIQKLDADGNLVWGLNSGGTGDIRALEIKKSPNGNIFISGFYRWGSVDLDPSEDEMIVTTPYVGSLFFDGYMQEFDPDGNLVWAFGSTAYGTEVFYDFDIDDSSQIYIVGYCSYTETDFDLGPDTVKIPTDDKIFIWKMDFCDNTYDTLNDYMCDYYTVPSGDETYSSPGIFMDTIPNSSGCDKILTIHVSDLHESIDLEFDGETYTAYPSGQSYAWINCKGDFVPIPGETSQTFTPVEDGSYAVIVTSGDCADTSACISTSYVGLNTASENPNILIHPNPSNGLFNITVSEPMEIRIYSSIGQLITVKRIDNGQYEMNLKGLSRGIYILSASSLDGKQLINKKIMIN